MRYVPALLEVARQTMVLQLRNRMFRLLVFALLGIAGVMLLVCIENDDPGREMFAVIAWWLVGNVLMPWTTMYFGVQAVHGDIEDRTFQYLMVRPVPRTAVLLGKWLAVATLGALVGGLGMALVYAAARVHPALWAAGSERDLLRVYVLAAALLAVTYAAVAAWFGAMFKRPLVWAAAFIIGGQMFLANLPARAGIRLLTISDPVRRFVLDGIDANPRLARMLWPSERNWSDDLVGQPLLNLGVLVGAALLLALVTYANSEYDSRERE